MNKKKENSSNPKKHIFLLILKVYVLNFLLVEFTYNANRVPKTTTPFFPLQNNFLWETLEIGSSDLCFVNHFFKVYK